MDSLHRQRRAHSPVRVVRVGDGGAPERHDRVADELVERAAVLEDHLHHLGEVLAQELGDRVRAHALGDGGEAADVAEEHGGRTPLAALTDGLSLLRDVGGDVGGEVALEIGPHRRLPPDLLRVAGILDADGGQPAERDQELQVLVRERVGCGEVVHVEQAEHAVGGGHERRAHRAPDALHQDGLAAEAGVLRRVLRDDGDALLQDLVGDRAGNLHRLRLTDAAPRDGGYQLAGLLVPEHDGHPIHAHDLERGVHHGPKQPVEIELGGQLLRDLEQHLELEGLAGLTARGIHPELPGRRAVPAGDPRRHAAAHHQLTHDLSPGDRRLRRDGGPLDHRCRGASRGEPERHLAEGDRVLEREMAGGDPGAVDAGAVRAAQILHLDAIGAHGELRVPAGDRRIVDGDVAGESTTDDERPALG